MVEECHFIVHPADSSCNNGLAHATCGCPSELLRSSYVLAFSTRWKKVSSLDYEAPEHGT